MTKRQEDRNKAKKKRYRIRNWKVYNAALVQRGSLDIWMEKDVINAWHAPPRHVPGAPQDYSNAAITTALTVKSVFRLTFRALEGFLSSVFRQQALPLAVPDYSTVCRRSGDVHISLARRKKEKTVIIIDSTGAKVYGEGEWKVRQHGASKRRSWKKIHIAIDEDGEIRATEVTGNDTHDADAAKAVLGKETATITALLGDGGYDRRKVYDLCRSLGIADIRVPPRKDAKIWHHGNAKAAAHPRDMNLRAIRVEGRKRWKERIGYHLRSLIENTMFRLKTIFGERIASRTWPRQVNELTLRCSILNRMFALGMPESYAVA